MKEKEILEYNPLVLAFIGDSVHTLFVRDYFVRHENTNAHSQHMKSSKLCRASAQSEALKKIENILFNDEMDIVLRARNTKSNNIAKNASIDEYKKATSYEALIGYLYLLGREERLNEILEKSHYGVLKSGEK